MEITSRDIKFIREMTPKFEYPLNEIEKYARKNYIPIAKPEVAAFLNFIVKVKKPQNILEIGTAVGYSTIIMAKAYSKTHIVTIERDINLAEMAKENFKKAGIEDKIEIICGEAQEVLPNLSKKYDLIFVDAAKGHYREFYEESKRLLSKGGIFVWDNVLYKGYVVGEKNVKHKRRTIVYRMRDFIDVLYKDKTLFTVILPLGDGLAVSVKEE